MPDEALQASLQGRPRQAPDFSSLALAHLRSDCLTMHQLIGQYVVAPTQPQLDVLQSSIKDIQQTLQLLQKRGAMLVSSELSELLNTMSQNQTMDDDACLHTIKHSGQQLADYVAYLQNPGSIDSPFSLLPLINNCRACRNKELLSEWLVSAGGVNLSDTQSLPLPSSQQIDTFISHLKESRHPMHNALQVWFGDEKQRRESLLSLKQNFANLSDSCDTSTSMQLLKPLFDSAEFICQSVISGALDNGAALRLLFTRLERLCVEYSQLNNDDAQGFARPVPDQLMLNALYYVALSSEQSAKANTLRQRFLLDIFCLSDKAEQGADALINVLGGPLADSIHEVLESEMQLVRAWLDNADNRAGELDRLRDRLTKFESALTLLGAHESMNQLRVIRELLCGFDGSIGLLKSDNSDRIIKELARLERVIDTEVNAIHTASTTIAHNDLKSTLNACLGEAQQRLAAIEQDLINLFGDTSTMSPTVSVKQINAKLEQINSALQVLPMPEVSPLISGVQSFIARHENNVLSQSAKHDLATVMVSLGYYLNSVLQPNGAAGQLLLEAEEALLNLDIDGLEANDDTLSDGTFDVTRLLGTSSNNTEYDQTIVDHATDNELEEFIGESLQQMNIISSAFFEYRQPEKFNTKEHRKAKRNEMIQAYEMLQFQAKQHKSAELEALAKSNLRLLNSSHDSLTVQALLEESVAVLPQLINQFHGSGDKIFDLQALLNRIDDAAVEDLTLAMDVQELLDQSDATEIIEPPAIQELDDTSILTQGFSWDQSTEFESTHVLDTGDTRDLSSTNILDVTGDDVPVMTLDNTLEQVFYRECDQHIISLRKSVDDALAVDNCDDESQLAALNLAVTHSGEHSQGAAGALPSKELLRALHTLTGSAQTVDAQGIIAIAQPLQKAALQKQRNGERFNRSEIEYIGELIDVLQARLAAMEAEQPFADDNDAVMARLREFVAHSTPWMPERKPGLQLHSNVRAIENVFQEEARELLETLRAEAARLTDESKRSDAIDKIQRCLHTIKGSSRMAGQTVLADRAHSLEDEIASVEGAALDDVVRNGLGELQTLMLVEEPNAQDEAGQDKSEHDAAVSKTSEPMVLTEASFENLFALASRANVSQAKLGESMLRLRDAYTDIESTSARLQRLPHDHTDMNSAAVAEMLGDLESARKMMADALLCAEAEHTQGLRADSALHQTLIRAQLVSFSECRKRLQHTANDASNETGKTVEFVLVGEELNIDKAMFKKLMTPMEHLIRNAVVHGIEPETERMAAGKPAKGKVAVEAKIDGTDVLIEVSDDGAGIDQARIRKVLDRTGWAANDSSETLLDILTEPGFTTHADADQLGGRGLGLSTVKQLVEKLDGTIQLSMPEHGGTLFSLRIPQKIRINQIVLVEHHAHCYAIPVNFIRTVSDEQYDLTQTSVVHNDTEYNCCSLDAIIQRDIATDTKASAKRMILMTVHAKHIALLVDKVIGYREIIAQPLGVQISRLKRYLGGAILADGRVVLIPDFNRLIDPEKFLPLFNWSAANAGELTRTALIVDDSITMRVAAQTMLQNFGVEPSIARDGAEAVELISKALPDVLLVDIDMPRMNGFDFLRHLRILYPEHDIPVVMISTRDTDKDRNQAKKLGALDYLVKPYSESQMRNALISAGVLSSDQLSS